jgi:hypothetical protein
MDFTSPHHGLTDDQREHLYNNLRGKSVLLQHVNNNGIRVPEVWKLDYRGQRFHPKSFIASHPGRPPQLMSFDEVETMLVPDDFKPPPPDLTRDRTSKPDPLDGNEFEIDQIIAKKKEGRKTMYQVLWKGYPDNEPFDMVHEKDINQAALDSFHRFDRANRQRAAPILNQIISGLPHLEGSLATNITSSGRPSRVKKHSHRYNTEDFVASAMHSQGKEILMDGISSDFNLSDSSGVLEALETLMPSPNGWTKGHATRLANQLKGGKNFLQPQGSYTPGQPQRIATTELEIRALLEVIDFTLISSIVDTFSGGSTIKRIFKQESDVQVLCNDVDSGVDAYYHMDALQPSTYIKIKKEYGLDAVIISPTFAFLDLALPLAVLHAEQLVCCHVPGHYFTCAPSARFEWMRQLQEQKRLHVLAGLPIGPSHRRCLWLIIFKSEAIKRVLLRPGCDQYIGFSFHRASLLSQPQPLFEEKIGDLLEAKEDYIAHQCYCSAIEELAARVNKRVIPGITGKIFSRFPSSNVYDTRGEDEFTEPGSIIVHGRIIALFSKIGSTSARYSHDSSEAYHMVYFKECLKRISLLNPRPQSIAFPDLLGQGSVGSWAQYKLTLKEFAATSGIKVVTYHMAGF